jgi:hypothetical protein
MAASGNVGQELLAFATELYPICRSITGNGLRDTLRRIGRRIPLKIHEVPSGTRVFDWRVPLEWNIEGASIRGPDGRTVVDFRNHNLHVVNYSEPVDAQLDLTSSGSTCTRTRRTRSGFRTGPATTRAIGASASRGGSWTRCRAADTGPSFRAGSRRVP